MLTPELQKIVDMYAKTMREISIRLRIAAAMTTAEITTNYSFIDYETIAMNFRKIAELIIFANLIGHEKEYAAIYPDLNTVWKIGQLINKIKKLNPHFYPTALNARTDEKMFINGMDPIPDGEWMTEDELKDRWGKCSDLIHGHNPYKGELNYQSYIDAFDVWGEKIGKLISFHGVLLADDEHIVLCLISPIDQPNDPFVTILKKDEANKQLVNINYKPYVPKSQTPT